MVRVVYNFESIQYDGTNGQFICGTWMNIGLVSDDGQTLVYSTPEGTNTVHLNDYVIRQGLADQWGRVMPPDQYAAEFHELP